MLMFGFIFWMGLLLFFVAMANLFKLVGWAVDIYDKRQSAKREEPGPQ